MHDPVHLAGDELIMGKLERMSAVRFTDDGDPAVGQAVYDIAARKMDKYPAWADQINQLFGTNI